ncbi:hypothetical protein VDF76_21140 [Xanthomonas campestris pv. raphani]|uniref:hypothetical protein n=1 Tax=Xanthomonas campestris TaxID=339 RepID=UPI002B2349E4|nr:hypothetical protein [Xanthomonas campestris]MEA9749436.1 hypothetical protein [Xanthomonas campestris pv. raphani]
MKNIIGYDGGHTVYELGPATDGMFFFDALNAFVFNRYPNRGWSLLSDRLYKRYLKKEDLNSSADLMSEARVILAKISVKSIPKETLSKLESSGSGLNFREKHLDLVFSKYFDLFFDAKNSALSFFEDFEIYQPVKIVAVNMPNFILDKKRPNADYDRLGPDELPFWLH